MLKIAIYSRKSVETDTGESIKNQIAICKQYFQRQNEECRFEIFEDEGFSGGNINRPDFKRMMQLVKIKQFDVVAVYKVDRIARNIVDFVNVFDELDKLNVKLVSVTEGFDPSTPIGKMMMMLLASFAEMERMNIAQRVKDNMRELAKLGRWSGGTAPSGYSVQKVKENGKEVSYLKKEKDADNIKLIFQKYASGYTAFEIHKYFKLKGFTYNPKTIYGILTNPTYLEATEESIKYLENKGYTVYGEPNGCGFLPYNRRPRYKGIKAWKDKSMMVGVSRHEPAVDLNLWIAVQSQLEKKTVAPHPHESKFTFLTGGLMKCRCGSGMGVSPGRIRSDGTRLYYFTCSGKRYRQNGCSNLSLRVDWAESKVKDFLEKMRDKETLTKYYNSNKKKSNVDKDIKSINKKIASNKKAVDSLVDKLILLSNDAAKPLAERIENLTQESNALKEELLKLEREKLFNSNDKLNIDLIHKAIIQFLDTDSLEEKKKFAKDIFDKITWDSASKELLFFLQM
ncbi:recombinase family protein [Clostridium tyrobutyricum]|uniref:recombinase family protein n=1 Tax=Clostridium tyrobutyricum TaxID=1519 RepID=UPI0010AA9BFD|nr:recombinase family protein [Clostridium tyrobutyricum]QCH27950.1 DNA-invertase hin [Clostridium tyrobutyricum]